MAFEAVTNR
jgi:hypothetical protein